LSELGAELPHSRHPRFQKICGRTPPPTTAAPLFGNDADERESSAGYHDVVARDTLQKPLPWEWPIETPRGEGFRWSAAPTLLF